MPNFFDNPKAFIAKLTAMILFVICIFLPAKNDAVALKITNESITSQTDVIKVQITNNTRRKIGVYWTSASSGKLDLEIKIGDKWTRVPVKGSTDDVYVESETSYYPGETFEESFYVSRCLVPVLVPGEYRLSFNYNVYPDFNSSEYVSETAYVQFTVTE